MPNLNDGFMRMKRMSTHASMSASHTARLNAGLGSVSDAMRGRNASHTLLVRIMGDWERVASAVCLQPEAQLNKRVLIRGGGARRERNENESAVGAASRDSGDEEGGVARGHGVRIRRAASKTAHISEGVNAVVKSVCDSARIVRNEVQESLPVSEGAREATRAAMKSRTVRRVA